MFLVSSFNMRDILSCIGERETSFVLFLGKAPSPTTTMRYQGMPVLLTVTGPGTTVWHGVGRDPGLPRTFESGDQEQGFQSRWWSSEIWGAEGGHLRGQDWREKQGSEWAREHTQRRASQSSTSWYHLYVRHSWLTDLPQVYLCEQMRFFGSCFVLLNFVWVGWVSVS